MLALSFINSNLFVYIIYYLKLKPCGILCNMIMQNNTLRHETITYTNELPPAKPSTPDGYPPFRVDSGEQIDAHLRRVIEEPPNKDLFFSIYLDLSSQGNIGPQLRKLVQSVQPVIDNASIYELFHAESCILDIVSDRLRDEHMGLAVHIRGGSQPVVHAIAFHVPIQRAIMVDRVPNVVPLIEMRDAFDRYVVLITTESKARIMEIVLGTVTREAWLTRPELRKRVGREWTREHYRNHRRERNDQFINEKIAVIRRLMQKRGYSHLVLAGTRKRVAAVERALPKDLRNRILDVCNLRVADPREKVVRKTINLFVEEELRESAGTLERLRHTLLTGGSAVVGLDDCERAIEEGLVESLVITRNEHSATKRIHVFRHRSPNGNYLTVEKRREQLLKQAVLKRIHIEFVPDASFLDDYYGVGAILRHNQYAEQVEVA